MKTDSVRSAAVIAFALGLGAGCGPRPPTDVHVERSPDHQFWEVVVVTFTDSPDLVDGYHVECSVEGGEFLPLKPSGLPDGTSAWVIPGTTELHAYKEGTETKFRVRAISDGVLGEPSEEVPFTLPLRPVFDLFKPFLISYEPEMQGWSGVPVGWYQNSNAATAIRIERQNGAEWNLIAVGDPHGDYNHSGTSIYYDRTAQEGAYYWYRATNVMGALESLTVTMEQPSSNPVFSASDLTVTPGANGPTLNWVNNSPSATSIRVSRGLASDPEGLTVLNWTPTVAMLPSTATSYTDSGLPSGYYVYEIVTNAPAGSSSTHRVAYTQ